jgi:hypothetical protein
MIFLLQAPFRQRKRVSRKGFAKPAGETCFTALSFAPVYEADVVARFGVPYRMECTKTEVTKTVRACSYQ